MGDHSAIDHSGLTGVISSYGSNANSVSSVSAAGASTSVSRADHVHVGVTSITHTSNTISGGALTIVAEGSIGITRNGQTISINSTGSGGGAAAASVDPAGTILAETVDTGGSRSITSATLANIPTTAITVTFTAPSTGRVDYEMSAIAGATSTANATQAWGILNESNTLILGTTASSIVVRQPGSGSENFNACVIRYREASLTPGNSYTRKWAASCSTSGGTLIANTDMPAIMRVVKAP